MSRKSAHRKAMLANMACSLLLHKRITTTVAKAKALKIYVEPLITKAKQDSTHNRRIVFSYLQDKDAVSELFREISAKIGDRPGGYTRILKTGTRLGDAADMCIIELVDYNESMLGTKEAKATSSRRRRAGKKKDDATVVAPKTAKAKKVAEVVEEVIDEAPAIQEPVVEEQTEAEAQVEENQDETPEAEESKE